MVRFTEVNPTWSSGRTTAWHSGHMQLVRLRVRPCDSVKSEMKCHLERKLRFPFTQFMLRQMHSTERSYENCLGFVNLSINQSIVYLSTNRLRAEELVQNTIAWSKPLTRIRTERTAEKRGFAVSSQPVLYQQPEESGSGFSLVDPDAVDLNLYPKLAEVEWTYARLGPGDCIYIPSGQERFASALTYSSILQG